MSDAPSYSVPCPRNFVYENTQSGSVIVREPKTLRGTGKRLNINGKNNISEIILHFIIKSEKYVTYDC